MIPRQSKVGAHVYETILRPYDTISGAGRVNHARLEIEVAEDVAPTKQEEAYLEELIHAAVCIAGFLSNDNISVHEWVDRYSDIVYAVLKQNNLLNFPQEAGQEKRKGQR